MDDHIQTVTYNLLHKALERKDTLSIVAGKGSCTLSHKQLLTLKEESLPVGDNRSIPSAIQNNRYKVLKLHTNDKNMLF